MAHNARTAYALANAGTRAGFREEDQSRATAVCYYDRPTRSWWAYAQDSNDDQIGDAVFANDRTDARNTLCVEMLDRVAQLRRDDRDWTRAWVWCNRAMERGIGWTR